MHITDIQTEEVVDSRGKSSLNVTALCGEARGSFSVPSGASTGAGEALELRDADGGMQRAMRNIETIIKPALLGMDATDQKAIDEKMRELDGTAQKTVLGGNAMIGVSIACTKAASAAKGVEVFEHLHSLADIAPSRTVPFLYMNYINGGKHAQSPLAFQEHIIVPQTENVAEAIVMGESIGGKLSEIIGETYGREVANSCGDEGGYVIPESKPDAPFALLVRAIADAGYEDRVRLATDVAASSFYENGSYKIGDANMSADELLALHTDLIARFDLLSIEDPFEENALADFARLQKANSAVRIVGDDLTVTDASRIARAVGTGAIKAVIIKPNQIGTLSETLDAMHTARARGIDCIVSHRSGETDDTFIADLSFAFGTFGIKAGALRKRERRVKYERLAAIAHGA